MGTLLKKRGKKDKETQTCTKTEEGSDEEENAQIKNWKLFIEKTQAKARGHEKVAEYWDKVNTYLNLFLIILSAITTVMAAIKDTPKMATVALSGVTTLVSTVVGKSPFIHHQFVGLSAFLT